MCTPAVGIMAAGQIANYVQQDRFVTATNRYQRSVFRQNREIATANALLDYEALDQRGLQEKARLASELDDINLRAMRTIGTAKASAAAGGVMGLSFSALLDDFKRQELSAISGRTRSSEFLADQIERQKESTRFGLQSDILRSTPVPLQRPNLFGAALNVAAGGINLNNQNTLLERQIERE